MRGTLKGRSKNNELGYVETKKHKTFRIKKLSDGKN